MSDGRVPGGGWAAILPRVLSGGPKNVRTTRYRSAENQHKKGMSNITFGEWEGHYGSDNAASTSDGLTCVVYKDGQPIGHMTLDAGRYALNVGPYPDEEYVDLGMRRTIETAHHAALAALKELGL